MGMAFVDLLERLALLKRKHSLYERLKESVTGLRDETNSEAVDEVLLDLDEFCVGPLEEEIEKIEKAEVKVDGKAKRKKAANKKGAAKDRGKAKGGRKSR